MPSSSIEPESPVPAALANELIMALEAALAETQAIRAEVDSMSIAEFRAMQSAAQRWERSHKGRGPSRVTDEDLLERFQRATRDFPGLKAEASYRRVAREVTDSDGEPVQISWRQVQRRILAARRRL
jgi:hypothetical protein